MGASRRAVAPLRSRNDPKLNRLQPGKIPIDLLNSTVLQMTGAESDKVVTPPKAGLDFAAIKLNGGYLVVSADPITGVEEGIGRYAVNISANDVATSGNRPQFAESVVLMPSDSSAKDVRLIAKQMHIAAKGLGITIVGGHTEVTPGLRRPIVAVTTFSFVKSYVSSQDAHDGDTIMMTKTAGLEGTAAIAGRRLFGRAIPRHLLERASGFVSKISVVEEAVAAYESGYVHAMHDCTEGGVLGAVFEMSLASGLGFVLRQGSVPVANETRLICRELSLDSLRLIGSGSLLLSVEKGKEDGVADALRRICKVTSVGEFKKGKRMLVGMGGREEVINSAPEDELWHALGERGMKRRP